MSTFQTTSSNIFQPIATLPTMIVSISCHKPIMPNAAQSVVFLTITLINVLNVNLSPLCNRSGIHIMTTVGLKTKHSHNLLPFITMRLNLSPPAIRLLQRIIPINLKHHNMSNFMGNRLRYHLLNVLIQEDWVNIDPGLAVVPTSKACRPPSGVISDFRYGFNPIHPKLSLSLIQAVQNHKANPRLQFL